MTAAVPPCAASRGYLHAMPCLVGATIHVKALGILICGSAASRSFLLVQWQDGPNTGQHITAKCSTPLHDP